MALSKIEKRHGNVQLIVAPEAKRIPMGFSKTAEGLLLDRLTDIYRDPIEATFREVVSNAYDATMQLPVNERKPIQIIMPIPMAPTLVIQDFGVGMTLEEVTDYFIQYGNSSKVHDMVATGSYGLGAKAPLAYASSFTAETTKAGWTTKFRVSRESGGAFTDIISHSETDKPNGTAITIPVSLHDVGKFERAASYYDTYGIDVPLTYASQGSHSHRSRPVRASWTLVGDDLVLDEDTGLTGRVWVNKENIIKLFADAYYFKKLEYMTTLSGWPYANRSGEHHNAQILVELKPGVVNFSSSRDSITMDDRFEAFDAKVNDYIATRVYDFLREHYRTLPNDKAEVFFKRFIAAHQAMQTVRLNGKSIGPKHFKTHSGFNPAEGYMLEQAQTALASFALRANGRISRENIIMDEYSSYSPNRAGLAKLIVARLQKKSEMLHSPMGIMDRGYYGGQRTDKLIAVTGVTEENASRLLGALTKLYTSHPNAVVTLGNSKMFNKQIDYIEASKNMTVLRLKADEVLAEAKAARGKKADIEDTVFNLSLITEAYDSTVTRNPHPSDRPATVPMSLAQLKKKGAKVIITSSYGDIPMRMAMAAFNRGLLAEGEALYLFLKPHRTPMESTLLPLLMDPLFIIDTNISLPRSKAATAVAAKAFHPEMYRDSDVLALHRDQILNYTWAHIKYMIKLSPWLRERLDATKDASLLKALDTLCVDPELNSLRTRSSFSVRQIDLYFKEEHEALGKAFDYFLIFCQKPGSKASYTFELIHGLLTKGDRWSAHDGDELRDLAVALLRKNFKEALA